MMSSSADYAAGWYSPGSIPVISINGADPEPSRFGASVHEQLHQALSVVSTYGHAQSLSRRLRKQIGPDYLRASRVALYDSSFFCQEGAAANFELMQLARQYGMDARKRRLRTLSAEYVDAIRNYEWIISLIRSDFLSEDVVSFAVIAVAQAALSTPILNDLIDVGFTDQSVVEHLADPLNRPDDRLLLLGEFGPSAGDRLLRRIKDSLSSASRVFRGDLFKSSEMAVPIEKAVLEWIKELNIFEVVDTVGHQDSFEENLYQLAIKSLPSGIVPLWDGKVVSADQFNMEREVISVRPKIGSKGVFADRIESDGFPQWVVDKSEDSSTQDLVGCLSTALNTKFYNDEENFVGVSVALIAYKFIGSSQNSSSKSQVSIQVRPEGAACEFHFSSIVEFLDSYTKQSDIYGSVTVIGVAPGRYIEYQDWQLLVEKLDSQLFVYEPIFVLDDIVDAAADSRYTTTLYHGCDPLPDIIVVSGIESPRTSWFWLISSATRVLIEEVVSPGDITISSVAPIHVWNAAWHAGYGEFSWRGKAGSD